MNKKTKDYERALRHAKSNFKIKNLNCLALIGAILIIIALILYYKYG